MGKDNEKMTEPRKPRAPRKPRKKWAPLPPGKTEQQAAIERKKAREARPKMIPVDRVTVSRNLDQGGIEIRFPEKPPEDVRQWMKAKGLKWSTFYVMWWAKFDELLYQEILDYFTDERGC